MKNKRVAIVLAAGKGKRMGGNVHKQYLLLQEKPILCYCLDVFEKSFIDEIILVVGAGEQAYCDKEIVQKYGYQKISKIVEGGKERYHSVFAGLKAIESAEYVFIHDGARPFISENLLQELQNEVVINKACVAAVPVKDTIKVSDEKEIAIHTPDRSTLWAVQTPQVFSFDEVKSAYERLFFDEQNGTLHKKITDDCMVLEDYMGRQSKLVFSSYKNIKITTEEDLMIAQIFVQEAT
jgi:2-C-methyl-D-erythritol 4-phosphate cytidylyltransferase